MNFPPRYIPAMGPPKSSSREQVLAEWRGQHLEREEKARAKSALPIGQVMPGIFKTLRLEQRQAETEVLRAWNELLDPTVTAHAQPVGLNKGTLFVKVDSNVWMAEIIRFRRREMLQRLQHCFGRQLIQKISFRLG